MSRLPHALDAQDRSIGTIVHGRRGRLAVAALSLLLALGMGAASAQAADTWSPAAAMTTPRSLHTATALTNGKVLVTGGLTPGPAATTSAELYDPGTDTWSPAADMGTPRAAHTATRLADGRVLVTGGFTGSGFTTSAELYDPASDSWSPAGSMGTPRVWHTATALPDGKVLVTGGQESFSGATATAERYDPATDAWSPAATMFPGLPGSTPTPRYGHTATALADGRVLVAGAANGATCPAACGLSTLLYDPATDAWTFANYLSIARGNHTATALAGGQVLVTGGDTGSGATATVERYDVATTTLPYAVGTWSQAAGMSRPRSRHTATALADGQVLVAGGGDGGAPTASAERYDPAADSWSPAGSMSTPRESQTATVVADGRVLVTGGDTGSGVFTASAELYGPAASTGSTSTTLTGQQTTVSTGSTATAEVPVQTQVAVPAGPTGPLSIQLQTTSGGAPNGYSFFGRQVVVTGPAAGSASDPYVITFTVDASLLGDVAPADLQLFRNGTVVGGCADATTATPNPCVVSRSVGDGGDAIIVVRTTAFSTWNVGRLAYSFSGFFGSVANPPGVNAVKAGSTVALVFSLGADRGLDVLAGGFPKAASFGSGSTCTSPPPGPTGGSVTGSLSYDARTKRYTYAWKTEKTITGCRQLTLRLRDGTTRTAIFSVTR